MITEARQQALRDAAADAMYPRHTVIIRPEWMPDPRYRKLGGPAQSPKRARLLPPEPRRKPTPRPPRDLPRGIYHRPANGNGRGERKRPYEAKIYGDDGRQQGIGHFADPDIARRFRSWALMRLRQGKRYKLTAPERLLWEQGKFPGSWPYAPAMTPGSYPLALYRGDSYAWQFVCWEDAAKTLPADLTGAVAKAQIRNVSGGGTIIDMACAIAASTITVNLYASAWTDWPANTKVGVWDLQLTWAGVEPVVQTIMAGPVAITLDVTDSDVTATAVRAAAARPLRSSKVSA